MTGPRPHDLLRIAASTQLSQEAPPWVSRALRDAPWVVVRRARCEPGHVAVGIRGPSRSHRHAAVIETGAVAEIVSPPDLVDRIDQLPDLPATAALRSASVLLAPTGLRWGPAGSVGFCLATGVPVVTPTSDLDLVLRVDDMPPFALLAELSESFGDLPARVDCQLDLPIGGVALADLLGRTDQVLVRTDDGPALMNVDRPAS